MDRPVALVPQAAARRIQEMIHAGDLRQGEMLPPQRELSERLNVSRASLREALSVLETLGLLRTEPRRGTRVTATEVLGDTALHPWRFGKRYSLSEVYQFRFVTEGYAARLAATRTSTAELNTLKQSLRDFKDAVRERDLVASSQLDFGFHKLIMEHSGNRVFTDLHGSFGSVLLESQRLPLAQHERLWEPVNEHENIVQAIEKRDPDGASYFMHVHITRAADRVGVSLSDKV